MKSIIFSFLLMTSTTFSISYANTAGFAEVAKEATMAAQAAAAEAVAKAAEAAKKDAYSFNNIKGFEAFTSPEDLQEENKKVIFYFTAAWCGPCQATFPKVDALVKANPDKYKLVLAQFKNQAEIDKASELFGANKFWPYGFVLNSKVDSRDNGEKVIVDIASIPRYVALNIPNADYQFYVPYMLYAITGQESFVK